MPTNHYMDIDFTISEELTDDRIADLVEEMDAYLPSVSVSRDRWSGSISLYVEARDVLVASTRLMLAVEAIQGVVGRIVVTNVAIMDEATRDAKNNQPTFPEFVMLADIGELLGVTRQRARQIALRQDFPASIATTRAGELYEKAAVLRWIEVWPRTTGRPRKI